MGKGGGGSSPDVVGAARETGEQALRLNEAQTLANRPNQSNAWGSTSWDMAPVWNPITGEYNSSWTQTETLDPDSQRALDSQQNIQAGRSELAEGMMARAWDSYQNPMDFSQFGDPIQMAQMQGPQSFDYQGQPLESFSYDQPIEGFEASLGDWRQQAQDAAYGRSTSRLDPQFQQREQELLVRLRNQGLSPGDQAYDAAMANFSRERGDAYEQARLGSTLEGRAEADQYFGQQLGTYQTNLGAQNQGFGQALASQQQNMGQNQQQFQQELAANQANLGVQDQAFGQNVTQNQMANALRNQQVQEALFQRGYSLDEVERMLAGQYITGGPPATGGQTSTLVGNMLSGG
jgi:hypothetical protein